MRRRVVQGVVVAVVLPLLTGCVLTPPQEAAGSVSMEPVDGADLPERASKPLPPVNPTSDPTVTRDDVVRRAIEQGAATVASRGAPASLHPNLPYRHDGGYYRLSNEVVGTETGYDVRVELDLNASSVTGSVVAYEDLPAVDRYRLDRILSDLEYSLRPGYDALVDTGYNRAEANASVLVPEPAYDAVEYRGQTYPVRTHVKEVTFDVYRYEATLVAADAAAYREVLRERYVFELSGLSEAETAVVDQAIDDRYAPDGTDDEGFESLVERFREHRPVAGDENGGSWVVRYDGRLYWTEVDYGYAGGEQGA